MSDNSFQSINRPVGFSLKSSLLVLALCGSVVGCFDDSLSSTASTSLPETGNGSTGIGGDSSETGSLPSYHAGERPHVKFAPHSQQMDLVNDLRFGSRFASGVDYHTADDGVVSINGRRGLTLADSDGFSTSAQFDVTFSQSLDPDSVSFSGPDQNVFVLPLQSNSNDYFSLASYPGNGSKLIDRAKLAQQQVRANVVTLDGEASVLRISPLAPLAPKTKYLVVLTNTLRDINGQPIVPADDYYHFSHAAQPAEDSPLAEVVSRWHSMASDALVAIAGGLAEKGEQSYLSGDRKQAGEQIAHAFTFTTTTGTEMLKVLASPEMAKARPVGIIRRELTVGKLLDPFLQKLGTIFSSLDSESLAAQFGTTVENIEQLKQTDLSSLNGSTVDMLLGSMGLDYPSIEFVQGHITLPYYLAKPELDESGHINPAYLEHSTQFANDEWKTDASGIDSPTVVMSPKKTADYKVPFLVTLPEGDKPEGGWPVVIFQHGILGDRSNSFPAGMALASLCDKERPGNDCFATIAMDLPLHGISPQLLVGNAAVPSPFIGFGMDSLRAETNAKLKALDPSVSDYQQQKDKLDARLEEMDGIVERHFSATRTPTGKMTTMRWQSDDLYGSSGSTFMNFSNVLSQRDRMRQAVSDLLNLNASLADIDLDGDGEGDFDTSRVYFTGHSLGGVLGMPFVAVNNDPTVQKNNPGLPKVQAAALLTTGGGVPKLLEHSPGFRPEILGALKHLDTEQSLELGTKSFEHYFYTLQSVIDGVDPLNFAAKLKASDTGIYMAEVVGGAPVIDGYGYQQYTAEGEPMFTLPDQTIPNSADGKPTAPFKGSIAAPLAGTEPMIQLMGLQSLKPDADAVNQSFSVSAENNVPLKVVARFNRGTHVTPVMALENIQRLLVDNKELSKVISMSTAELIENQPIVHLVADSIKRSGGLFLEMTGHVSDFFTSNGASVAVNDADLLSRIDPHEGEIPLPPITLASKQPVTCEAGKVCIIDNDDDAFEMVGNSWITKSDRGNDTEGATYAYAPEYYDHAAWWFRVDKAGTYRVSMRTPSNFYKTPSWQFNTPHGATTGARYNVFSSSGESNNKLFNLVEGGDYDAPLGYPLAPNGKYVELGEFVFDDLNRDYKVALHNRSAEYKYTGPLIADAIKIEYVSANTNMAAAGELQRLAEQAEEMIASAEKSDPQGQHSQEAVNQLQHVLATLKQAALDNTMSVLEMQTLKRQFEESLTAFSCITPGCVSTAPQGTIMDNTDSNFSVTVPGTLKTANNGQYGDDYYYSKDENAVAEWVFEVAESGRYQIAFNSPGGLKSAPDYGSDDTLYQVLKGELVLAEKTVDTFDGETQEFEPLADSVYLFEGVQYKVRVSGAYYYYWGGYDCGLVVDAIKVTYQPE